MFTIKKLTICIKDISKWIKDRNMKTSKIRPANKSHDFGLFWSLICGTPANRDLRSSCVSANSRTKPPNTATFL